MGRRNESPEKKKRRALIGDDLASIKWTARITIYLINSYNTYDISFSMNGGIYPFVE
ncbi:hypothetical protein LY28_03001 [Ruminiclostridium sufflavum DSM 19573]|uniref:Uncharacterized protein n=1 Tax=Ruminiclostridium sufflavum DSM 19573 TaxID=1121337 RepID=A0A318XJQ9_9FIRM|nr:hypothetical protein LY28_03001 [Ruminiclostridium sufflavum DSM 19573]